MAHTEILKARTLHSNLKGQGLVQLIVFSWLPIRFYSQIYNVVNRNQTNINHPKFPCRICAKNVNGKDKALQCDLCGLWIHIKCNKLNYLDYRYLQSCD